MKILPIAIAFLLNALIFNYVGYRAGLNRGAEIAKLCIEEVLLKIGAFK